jgi:hypothetical protein
MTADRFGEAGDQVFQALTLATGEIAAEKDALSAAEFDDVMIDSRLVEEACRRGIDVEVPQHLSHARHQGIEREAAAPMSRDHGHVGVCLDELVERGQRETALAGIVVSHRLARMEQEKLSRAFSSPDQQFAAVC